MARRFLTSREKRQREASLKQNKKDIAKLKKLGLYEPKKAEVTSHAKATIRKYKDVLAGRATVVRAKGGKEKTARQRAKEYRGTFRVRGDKIVINHPPTAKPRFSAKTGEITIDVKNVGQIRRGRLQPIKIETIDDLRKIEREGFYFGVPFQRFGSDTVDWLQYDDVEEMIADMSQYAVGSLGKDGKRRNSPYKNWARYVVLIPKTK